MPGSADSPSAGGLSGAALPSDITGPKASADTPPRPWCARRRPCGAKYPWPPAVRAKGDVRVAHPPSGRGMPETVLTGVLRSKSGGAGQFPCAGWRSFHLQAPPSRPLTHLSRAVSSFDTQTNCIKSASGSRGFASLPRGLERGNASRGIVLRDRRRRVTGKQKGVGTGARPGSNGRPTGVDRGSSQGEQQGSDRGEQQGVRPGENDRGDATRGSRSLSVTWIQITNLILRTRFLGYCR